MADKVIPYDEYIQYLHKYWDIYQAAQYDKKKNGKRCLIPGCDGIMRFTSADGTYAITCDKCAQAFKLKPPVVITPAADRSALKAEITEIIRRMSFMKTRVLAEGTAAIHEADNAEWNELKERLDQLNKLALKYRETIEAARDAGGEAERASSLKKSIQELFQARSVMRKKEVSSATKEYARLLLESKKKIAENRTKAPVFRDAIEKVEPKYVNGLPEDAGENTFGKPREKSEPVIKIIAIPKEVVTHIQIAPPTVEGSLVKPKRGK